MRFEKDGGEGEEQGEGEEETPPEVVVAALTVTEGGDGAELPETDGTITAVDYGFEVDVQAGDPFTFRNDSSQQFHHAAVFNLGTIDRATVEENLPAFFEGCPDQPPRRRSRSSTSRRSKPGTPGCSARAGEGTRRPVPPEGASFPSAERDSKEAPVDSASCLSPISRPRRPTAR